MNNQERLRQIRQRHADAPHGWQAVLFSAEWTLEAFPPGEKTETSIREPYASINGDEQETAMFLSWAHDDIAFLLNLLFKSFEQIRELKAKPKDYAAEAAIKAQGIKFREYLMAHHGLTENSDEAATAKLKEILQIKSRKELNKNPAKASEWRDFVGTFERWLQHG